MEIEAPVIRVGKILN